MSPRTRTTLFSSLRSTTLALAALAAGGLAEAGTLFVDVDAAGANDGTSWADAYQGATGLQSALAAAVAGDQIWVAAGTYKPTATATRTIHFDLKTGVEIYGGFAGGEAMLGERDFVANPTILSGDLAGNDGANLFADNSTHVVRGNAATASAVLDGFTVRGGNANVAGGNNDRGGGFLMVGGGAATIRNCVVRENRCSFGGGAGYISAAGPTWTDVVFENNLGANFGGAFDMAGATNVVFTRCTFRGNSAARAGAVEIFSSGTTIRLTECLFTGNTATGAGGGGAIWVSGSSPSIRGCTIVGNTSTVQAAAGILGTAGTIVANCIVYGNSGPGGAQGAANQISAGTVSFSCVQGGFAGTGNLSADPQLADVGGGDFALSAGSPCIDAGNNAAVTPGTTLDLAGAARFADDPATADTGAGAAPIVDIGALERANTVFAAFCAGDGSLPTACPCGNSGTSGHGCANSDVFLAGALLTASGLTNPDTLVLTASDVLPSVLCIFLQGDAEVAAGSVFGDGVRCVGGQLKRLATRNASGGVVSFPEAGDPSISAQSAFLGDPIAPGTTRSYQVYYRDPVLGFCPAPAGNSWNVSSGIRLNW